MTELSAPERALAHIAQVLSRLGRSYALIGGLAVSVRGEVRFTRDVDIVVVVIDDDDAEALIFKLRTEGYAPLATVEHKRHHRLATARLGSPSGVVVDLMFSNCGIEREIVDRATTVDLPNIRTLPVASSEELVAMKVLSMTDARLQDRLDVQQLLTHGTVDLERVRANLSLIVERRYERDQDLEEKLQSLLEVVDRSSHS
jgi:predicted nucleotidyltransferase